MMQAVSQTLRWVLSLGKKFIIVVPVQTVLIVVLTLVSQISSLLAFFLPLKVVILLGSERIPRYFPDAWAALDKDFLIALLCALTLVFYLIHFLAERIIRVIMAWATRRLLQCSHKLVLFDNQENVAQDAYLRFSRALAGGVFVLLALIILAVFYIEMAGIILGYLVLVWLAYRIGYALDGAFHQKLANNLSDVLNFVAVIGFFCAFGYLVVDFIFFFPPSIIIAIVALLLSRQVMQRATSLIGDVFSLQRQKVKLDAIFFHGKIFLPALPGNQTEFWERVWPEKAEKWIVPVLKEFTVWQEGRLAVRWQQTGIPDTAAFLVETNAGDFWLKLYDKKRSTLMMHELALVVEGFTRLPALPFLGTSQIGSLHCVVFALPRGVFPEAAELKKMLPAVITSLWQVELTPGLIERYRRSHPMLWQRLRLPLLEKMQVAVTNELQQPLNSLLSRLSEIIALLQAMPVVLFTKDTGGNNLYLNELSEPLLLNWGRWSLEPIGAGYPVHRLAQLEGILAEAQETRTDLKSVTLEQVKFTAMIAALEGACTGQKYVDALAILPDLMPLLDSSLEAARLTTNTISNQVVE